jgi:hypothetical protein
MKVNPFSGKLLDRDLLYRASGRPKVKGHEPKLIIEMSKVVHAMIYCPSPAVGYLSGKADLILTGCQDSLVPSASNWDTAACGEGAFIAAVSGG